MKIEKEIKRQIEELSPKHECNKYCFPESGLNPDHSLFQKSTGERLVFASSKKSQLTPQ